ncbi:hypothetical protein Tco_0161027, partial [Tanacetum coccineum]
EPEQAPLLLEFFPKPVYPEFMPLEDDEDPEDDDDEDPEEDPADYLTDRDDDDDEEEEPSGDEANDEDEDNKEEEDHPTSADFIPPKEEIPSPPLLVSPPLPVLPPPLPVSPTYLLRFRATMIWQRAELPPTSHSLPVPPPIILSNTRASVSMMRAAAPSTYIVASRLETPPSGTPPLLHILLPTLSPPLLLPSTNRRADRPEVCLPPRKRLCIA